MSSGNKKILTSIIDELLDNGELLFYNNMIDYYIKNYTHSNDALGNFYICNCVYSYYNEIGNIADVDRIVFVEINDVRDKKINNILY